LTRWQALNCTFDSEFSHIDLSERYHCITSLRILADRDSESAAHSSADNLRLLLLSLGLPVGHRDTVTLSQSLIASLLWLISDRDIEL
jgi:hypothetical protein